MKQHEKAKTFLLIALAILGVFVLLLAGFATGIAGAVFSIPGLLFIISLSIVGQGNRLLWSVIFPFLITSIGALIYAAFYLSPENPEIIKLSLAFILVPIVPGLILWLASVFRRKRHTHLLKSNTAKGEKQQ